MHVRLQHTPHGFFCIKKDGQGAVFKIRSGERNVTHEFVFSQEVDGIQYTPAEILPKPHKSLIGPEMTNHSRQCLFSPLLNKTSNRSQSRCSNGLAGHRLHSHVTPLRTATRNQDCRTVLTGNKPVFCHKL